MGSIQNFVNQMDWDSLIGLIISAIACLLCITVHELCHGLAAYRLGDQTAKNAGRLTLNPIKHLDIMGLVMMLVVKVGWAKPVPVNMNNFKNPKRGMALTALAGPLSNFVTGFISLALLSLLLHYPLHSLPNTALSILVSFLGSVTIFSIGMGVFNLIPISPLDGSKIFFAFFPDRIYYAILKYERYVMIVLVLLTFFGFLSRPLGFFINGVLRGYCAVLDVPAQLFGVM
ncbi:MAG: site-2 protease family protein [Oscillospiraceae bacterium]|nr:site-2 protease family protein [Oscillospiraceae bacterium]